MRYERDDNLIKKKNKRNDKFISVISRDDNLTRGLVDLLGPGSVRRQPARSG
jgi:hypothetical protein